MAPSKTLPGISEVRIYSPWKNSFVRYNDGERGWRGSIITIGDVAMTAININIRADRELEAQAQSVLADLGLDMTTAFNAFLTQVVDKKALPFKTNEPKNVK